jgi:hypothetical protein
MYRGRKAASIENAALRVTVLEKGGHIAEIFDKATGINPLWTPIWASMEPTTFDPASTTAYGSGVDARLLAGIMGHNVCLDIFGGPSDEEGAAGFPVHGEAPVAPYMIDAARDRLTMRADLPQAQLRFEREVALEDGRVRIVERVENISACDRPIGWTQHVTLGPPFLRKGVTQFRASATRSRVYEGTFGPADYLTPGADFAWPFAPGAGGGTIDLTVFTARANSSAFTTHLMDPARDRAYFAAFTPDLQLAIAYIWQRRDFPWLGIWEENLSRTSIPWNGASITRGMEFGVSPFPETRRQMIDRGRLFDTPTYRWIPAKRRIEVEYLVQTASRLDELIAQI